MAHCNQQLGSIHYYSGNLEEALFHYNKALRYFQKVGAEANVAKVLGNIRVGNCSRIAAGSVVLVTLAGVIVLVPGMSLTVECFEMASMQLVSGSARLAGAVALFFGIAAVGAAIGASLREPFGHRGPELDGLRTFAVVTIVFFHAQVTGFDSSFIVLDLFFVLSGMMREFRFLKHGLSLVLIFVARPLAVIVCLAPFRFALNHFFAETR